MPAFQVVVRYGVFSLFVLSALVALASWLVRTRRLSPFGPVGRALRGATEPVLRPVERRLVRLGGNPVHAGWWLVVVVAAGGGLLLSPLGLVIHTLGAGVGAGADRPRRVGLPLIPLGHWGPVAPPVLRGVAGWFGVFRRAAGGRGRQRRTGALPRGATRRIAERRGDHRRRRRAPENRRDRGARDGRGGARVAGGTRVASSVIRCPSSVTACRRSRRMTDDGRRMTPLEHPKQIVERRQQHYRTHGQRAEHDAQCGGGRGRGGNRQVGREDVGVLPERPPPEDQRHLHRGGEAGGAPAPGPQRPQHPDGRGRGGHRQRDPPGGGEQPPPRQRRAGPRPPPGEGG